MTDARIEIPAEFERRKKRQKEKYSKLNPTEKKEAIEEYIKSCNYFLSVFSKINNEYSLRQVAILELEVEWNTKLLLDLSSV